MVDGRQSGRSIRGEALARLQLDAFGLMQGVGEIGLQIGHQIAFDDGEFDAEVRCVAVPVRDFTGQVIGAIGISGPIWRLSLQALQSRAKLVQAAADRLSAEFGAAAAVRA